MMLCKVGANEMGARVANVKESMEDRSGVLRLSYETLKDGKKVSS